MMDRAKLGGERGFVFFSMLVQISLVVLMKARNEKWIRAIGILDSIVLFLRNQLFADNQFRKLFFIRFSWNDLLNENQTITYPSIFYSFIVDTRFCSVHIFGNVSNSFSLKPV